MRPDKNVCVPKGRTWDKGEIEEHVHVNRYNETVSFTTFPPTPFRAMSHLLSVADTVKYLVFQGLGVKIQRLSPPSPSSSSSLPVTSTPRSN